MMTKILLCVLISLGVTTNAQENESQKYMRLLGQLQEKNTLRFGGHCNYQLEQDRQKHTKIIIDGHMSDLGSTLTKIRSGQINPGVDMWKVSAAVLQSVTALSQLPGQFCDVNQNLGCLANNTCGCAEKDESLGYPVGFQREGDKCKLKAGSSCDPSALGEKSSMEQNPFRIAGRQGATTCLSTDRCVIKDGTDECTKTALELIIAKKMEEFTKQGKNPQDIIAEARRGFCVCGGTSILASVLVVTFSTMTGLRLF